MNPGSIILLSRRKGAWYNPRVILSWLIASLSTKELSKVDTVATHTAVIFYHNDRWCVRDMDYGGNTPIFLTDYIRTYGNRIRIRNYPMHNVSPEKIAEFNRRCMSEKVEYDYFNLLFFQVIKALFGVFVGAETIKHRICSEDTARMVNIMSPIFSNPEKLTPHEIEERTRCWDEYTV